MKKTCTYANCRNGGKLGLTTTSWRWRLYCGVRCKEAHRAALYEEARRQKSTFRLFALFRAW